MSGFGAVKERTFALIETGEYVLTLNDLEFEADGPYGDSMKWEWLIALREDPTGYICRANGNEVTLRCWTGADVELGSQCHEWVQVLAGRKFEKGDEPPAVEDLLGRRMIAYLTHQAPKKGPNAGKLREKIVAGSAKPFKGPQPNRTVAQNVARPVQTEAEKERAELIERVEKQIGKAVTLNTPNVKTFLACDLQAAEDDQLLAMLQAVKDEVQKALDD